MSTFDNPFDPNRRLQPPAAAAASTSTTPSTSAPRAAAAVRAAASEDKRYEGVVASAVMRAVFPQDVARRAFLKSVGAATALAAMSQFFPLKTATEVFAQGAPLEKKDLKVGFIPITCATPIIMAAPMGFYSKHGLNVEVIKTAGWAVIRDKTINKEYDAAHMLSPMPLAITLGVGSNPLPYTVPAIENINGQAITLAIKHKDKRDPKDWKGFKFAVPFDYSMHNYLLRYYLAEHGIDPDTDVQIRAVPPPEMVANLRADNIDGFLGADPMTSAPSTTASASSTPVQGNLGRPPLLRASRPEGIHRPMPNTYGRWLKRSSTRPHLHPSLKSQSIAEAIAPASYLNAARIVLEQVLPAPSPTDSATSSATPRVDFDAFLWDPSQLDADPDEALGADQDRPRL